jgi:hypothetical protein
MLAEESANSSVWQGCQHTQKNLKKSVKNVTKISWQPSQNEELADSSANVGFLD